MAVPHAHGLGRIYLMAADVGFRDFHLGRGRGWAQSWAEVRESSAGANPNAAVGIGQERCRVAIVPDQAVLLIVMMPAHSVVDIHAAIAAVPDPSADVGADKQGFVGTQTIFLGESPDCQVSSIVHSDSGNAVRFAIADPNGVILGLRNVAEVIRGQTIFGGEAPPVPLFHQRQTAAAAEPPTALPIRHGVKEDFIRTAERKLDAGEMHAASLGHAVKYAAARAHP